MNVTATKLQNLIGYTFKDPELLERALTHRSWAYENMEGADEIEIHQTENESLEFLGDSVLGLVIAESLFERHPGKSEGDLTLMKHHLVSTATLASLGASLSLGEFVRFGKGEEKTGGRKKQALLANSLEAVIGAVFIDGGYSAARLMIRRLFADELKNATPSTSIDYKTMLQELLQGRRLTAPRYVVVETVGPPHDRTFTVEAKWDGGTSLGQGPSIKAAEMKAAAEAYGRLDTNNGNMPASE